MSNIAIFSEVGGRSVLAVRRHYLVHRVSFRELRVQAHAELARATRTCIASLDDGWINVFHGWAPYKQGMRFRLTEGSTTSKLINER